ncbi:MAG TPA: acVLRF1 family peptidyl-tRNA hydrolase [Pseudonocardiaceae bacterium]|nr:acVLRF1 family peptidyl-tRNA hydrolase [Pseudonocardiaceae bacterium]
MGAVRSAPGGGRIVEISPSRVSGWFDRFGERHGGVLSTDITADTVTVLAEDGATATVTVPFPPLTAAEDGLDMTDLVAHLLVPRRIGLLLVRLGGHSVGIAEAGLVLVSATDRTQVHGRNKAGGWSQQRFARRRAGQARVALRSAADDAVRVLVPRLPELVAVVLGGDRRALEVLREDGRLAAVFALAQARVLEVAEPRRAVLDDAAERAMAVEILVTEP